MNTSHHDARIAKMTFASVYPMYVEKVTKKGRTKEELHEVIAWLTGFKDKKLQELIDKKVTFEQFFEKAKLNPNARLITGYRQMNMTATPGFGVYFRFERTVTMGMVSEIRRHAVPVTTFQRQHASGTGVIVPNGNADHPARSG